MSKYIKKSNVEATLLDNEWILLNVDKFTVTKVNQLGGYCWDLLNEVQTLNELYRSIRVQFPESEELTITDIEQYLTQLIECGLVEHDI
jgi:hypothetical protein